MSRFCVLSFLFLGLPTFASAADIPKATAGRPTGAEMGIRTAREGRLFLTVRVSFSAPMAANTKPTLLYASNPSGMLGRAERPQPNRAISDAKVMPLKIEGSVGVAVIELPTPTSGTGIAFQVEYGAGKDERVLGPVWDALYARPQITDLTGRPQPAALVLPPKVDAPKGSPKIPITPADPKRPGFPPAIVPPKN